MPHAGRRSRLVFALSTLLLILVIGSSIWLRLSTTQTHETRPLRNITVAQFGDFFLYAPLYVAIDGGYFANNGLNVSLVNTGGDDKTWAAVLGGSAQFGVADPTFVAISAARGQPGIVVAGLVNGVPFWGITFKNIPPFTTAKDLDSYSVATFPSPSTAYTLQKEMFVDAGLKPNIREGAFGAILPMLKAGTADIGLELEPNVSQAVNDGARIVYSLAKTYGNFAITGVTTTVSTVKTDPRLVHAFVAAIQEALDLLHTDPQKALSLLLKRFPGISHTVATEALNRVLREGVIPQSTTISENAWNKAIHLRVQVGDLKEAAPYSRFVWVPK